MQRKSLQLASSAACIVAAALVGCSPAESGPCTTPFLGDASQMPRLEVIAVGPNAEVTVVEDGASVPLMFPPQGGRVIFAGVRATNVDACGADLGGALRDETSQQVRIDERTVNLVPTSDGWGGSDPTDVSTFANIPVCPNQWSDTNIFGTEYELSLTITDKGGRVATKTLKVTPVCAEPDRLAECTCICKGGYTLGESCDNGAN